MVLSPGFIQSIASSDMIRAIKAIVWVSNVLDTYKTNLKPHKYLCKQYNHSTLNNFCKRSFPQKDLVWRLEHIFIVFQNSTTSATWCYFYNPHTFSILKSKHFICTIYCDQYRRDTFTAVHICSTIHPKSSRFYTVLSRNVICCELCFLGKT